MAMLTRRSAIMVVALALGVWLQAVAAMAQTKIAVSPDFQAVYAFDQEQTSRIQCYPLSVGRAGDIISLNLHSSRNTDLRFTLVEGNWIADCNIPQLSFALPGQPFRLAHDGPVSVVVNSSNWLPLTENRIQGVWTLSRKNTAADIAAIQATLGRFAAYVDARFLTRPFTIIYRPCGAVNATTDRRTGDITLCTELINSDISERLQFAIFLHELGHSLLSGWNERGGDRESDCDDFAAAMLMKEEGGLGGVQELANYFAQHQNNWVDQFNQIAAGDPHPPNIQRANLLMGSLYGNDMEFVRSWNRTLYPHMRTEWLQQVGSGNFESPDIAASVLQSR